MKAKARKRLLISSIAMLLVAMLALGTATFAWFTNSTTAKANGLTMTASASKGLVVTTDGTNWGTNQSWATPGTGTSDTMIPFSVAYTKGAAMPDTGIYATKAGTEGAWTTSKVNDGYEYSFASQAITAPGSISGYTNYAMNNYFLAYKVKAKVQGGVTATNYALTAKIVRGDSETNNVNEFVRIAVVSKDAFGSGETAVVSNGVAGVYGDAATKALVLDSDNEPQEASAASAVVALDTEFSLGNLTGATEREFYVYVWLEGQDEHCVDAKQQAKGNYRIEFSIPANSFN